MNAIIFDVCVSNNTLVDRNGSDAIEHLMSPGLIYDVVKRDAVRRFLHKGLIDNSFRKFVLSFISAKLFPESDLVLDRNECVHIV